MTAVQMFDKPLRCKCTDCGSDQSEKWGAQLMDWVNERFASRQQYLASLDHELKKKQQLVVSDFARIQAPAIREAERMRKHAEQAEARALRAESKLASVKKVARREVLREIASGRLDPYEFLLVEVEDEAENTGTNAA